METPKQREEILIVAGEVSGDILGGMLIKEINHQKPHIHFYGIGGDRMIQAGMEVIYHVKEMSFLGFFEVIRYLPFIRKVFYTLIHLLKERKPRLVILVDYPGFNLRLAKKVKKAGFCVIYYVSPQVWAWGKNRINKIVKWVDRMLVIFPFEEELYRCRGLDTYFVGHPLKDIVYVTYSKSEFFQKWRLNKENLTIGILPGSRRQEIVRLLPEMLRAVHILKMENSHIQAVVGIAPHLERTVYESCISEYGGCFLVEGYTYEVMAHSDVVIVASGTATLETAILATPMVVVYKVSPLSYILGRILIKIKHIAMANIVAGRRIVPELLQKDANAVRIANEVSQILYDQRYQMSMRRNLDKVSKSLGKRGGSIRAASLIIEFIERFDNDHLEP